METLAFNTRLPIELKQKLDDLSEREGTSIKIIVERALEAYLDPNNGPLARRLGVLDLDAYLDHGLQVLTFMQVNGGLKFTVINPSGATLSEASAFKGVGIRDNRLVLTVEAPEKASVAPPASRTQSSASSSAKAGAQPPQARKKKARHAGISIKNFPADQVDTLRNFIKDHGGTGSFLAASYGTQNEAGSAKTVSTAIVQIHDLQQVESLLTSVKQCFGVTDQDIETIFVN